MPKDRQYTLQQRTLVDPETAINEEISTKEESENNSLEPNTTDYEAKISKATVEEDYVSPSKENSIEHPCEGELDHRKDWPKQNAEGNFQVFDNPLFEMKSEISYDNPLYEVEFQDDFVERRMQEKGITNHETYTSDSQKTFLEENALEQNVKSELLAIF
ncbi:hypothetical protein SUGI_0753410 [Cryptomeria japonica]|nr:hypothetical protein SUGI_0753410 [Cryptomeria japonica]